MRSYKYYINTKFCLRGEHLAPDQITTHLQIQPTRFFKKGDIARSGSGQKHARKFGLWSLVETGESSTTDIVSELLNVLISKLQNWDSKMITDYLVEDPFLDIYVLMTCSEIHAATCEFSLSPSDLKLVSSLEVPVKVTVEIGEME